MNDKLAAEFPTTAQQLEWVRGRIEKYFPVAHAGISEVDGPEWAAPSTPIHVSASVPDDSNDRAGRGFAKSLFKSIATKLKLANGSRRHRRIGTIAPGIARSGRVAIWGAAFHAART